MVVHQHFLKFHALQVEVDEWVFWRCQPGQGNGMVRTAGRISNTVIAQEWSFVRLVASLILIPFIHPSVHSTQTFYSPTIKKSLGELNGHPSQYICQMGYVQWLRNSNPLPHPSLSLSHNPRLLHEEIHQKMPG